MPRLGQGGPHVHGGNVRRQRLAGVRWPRRSRPGPLGGVKQEHAVLHRVRAVRSQLCRGWRVPRDIVGENYFATRSYFSVRGLMRNGASMTAKRRALLSSTQRSCTSVSGSSTTLATPFVTAYASFSVRSTRRLTSRQPAQRSTLVCRR